MIVLYKWKSLTMGSSDWGFFLVSGEILLYVHPGRDRDRLVWMKHACVGVLGLPLSVPSFSRPCSGSLWEKFLSWLSWSHWDLQSPSSIENTPSSHCKREGGQLRPNNTMVQPVFLMWNLLMEYHHKGSVTGQFYILNEFLLWYFYKNVL